MNKFHFFTLFLAVSIISAGCARDTSPLKSDLELRVNQTFQTDFDYLDQMEFYRWNEVTSLYNLAFSLKDDHVREFGLLLAESQQIEDQHLERFPVLLILATSTSKSELNKGQIKAELYLVQRGETVILKYKDRYYEGSDRLIVSLQSAGLFSQAKEKDLPKWYKSPL